VHDTDRKDERNFVTTIGTEMAPAKAGTATKAKPSEHKVLIYIEHHGVCPLVGIGTPPPL
jgi:hypothetical protein